MKRRGNGRRAVCQTVAATLLGVCVTKAAMVFLGSAFGKQKYAKKSGNERRQRKWRLSSI